MQDSEELILGLRNTSLPFDEFLEGRPRKVHARDWEEFQQSQWCSQRNIITMVFPCIVPCMLI